MRRLLQKLKRQTGSQLGIDIGSHSIKIVELRTTASGTELEGSAISHIPAEARETEPLAAHLRQVLRDHGFSTRQAVVAVGGSEVAVRRVSLPAVPEDEIVGAIRWQAQKSFPFPIEDALITFQVLFESKSEGQTSLEVLAVAATREAVMRKVDVLQEAGLNCVGVVAEPHILAHLWESVDLAEDEEGAQAIVDLGASKSGVHIFQNGILQFSRDISTSGSALTETISGVIGAGETQIEVDSARAEALKHEFGIPTEGDERATSEGIALPSLAVRMRPVLEKLETEVSRSLDYYSYQFRGDPVARLLLIGGGSQLKGIETSFSEWFDMEVMFLDPLAAVLGEGKVALPQLPASSRSALTVATGLALPVPQQYNLLPAEIRVTRGWKISGQMAYAALGLLLLLPLAQYYWQGENRIDAVQQAAAASKRQLDSYQDLLTEYERLQLRSSQLDAQLAALPEVAPHVVPLASAMQIVSNSIPANMALTGMEIRKQEEPGLMQLQMRGLVFGPEKEAFALLTGFMDKLKKTPTFQEVEIGSAVDRQIPAPATLSFEILAYIQ
jgi:type IV pilus assembly protein PilM